MASTKNTKLDGARKVTFASVIWTNGKRTCVGIYRARMKYVGLDPRAVVDLSHAEEVARLERVEVVGVTQAEWCAAIDALALGFATDEWPAFGFTFGEDDARGRSS